jgi:hypothetical protein
MDYDLLTRNGGDADPPRRRFTREGHTGHDPLGVVDPASERPPPRHAVAAIDGFGCSFRREQAGHRRDVASKKPLRGGARQECSGDGTRRSQNADVPVKVCRDKAYCQCAAASFE